MTPTMLLTTIRERIETGDLAAAEALLPVLSPTQPTALNLAMRIRLGRDGMDGALDWLEAHRGWLAQAPGMADIVMNALACLRPGQMGPDAVAEALGQLARLDVLPLAPEQRMRLRVMRGNFYRVAQAQGRASSPARPQRARARDDVAGNNGQAEDAARQAALALVRAVPDVRPPHLDRTVALALLELVYIEDAERLAESVELDRLAALVDFDPLSSAILDGLRNGLAVDAWSTDPVARRLLALTWLRAPHLDSAPVELRQEWENVLPPVAGHLSAPQLERVMGHIDAASWSNWSLRALTEAVLGHADLSRAQKWQLLETGLAGNPTAQQCAFERLIDLYRDTLPDAEELRAALLRWPHSQKLWRLLFRVTLHKGQEDPALLVARMRAARPDLAGTEAAGWHALALRLAGQPEVAIERLEAAATLETILAEPGARQVWAGAVIDTGDVPRMRSLHALRGESGAIGMRITAILEALDRLGAGEAVRSLPDDLFALVRQRAPGAYRPSPRAGILVVTASLGPGGAERQTVATVNALDGFDGRRIGLVGGNLDPELRRDFFLPALSEQGRRVIDLTRTDLPAPADAFARDVLAVLPPDIARMAGGLCALIEAERPALIHAWQDTTNIAAAVAALVSGCPAVILSCRSLRPAAFKRARPWLRRAYRELLRDPRIRIYNNSRAGALDYADWLGLAPARIGVIENGMPLKQMRARAGGADRAATRRSWGLPADALILGGVMRMSEEKRPDLFIATAIAMCRADPRLHAVLAGRGPMEADLKAAVAAAGLAGRIRFPGHVSPVEPAMAAFDLLFLSSRIEGLPNVVIEAQALGVPVASMDVGGVAEALAPAPHGLLLAEAAPDELARRIAAFLAARREDAGTAAAVADFAERHFSMEAMARKTAAAYAAGLGPQAAFLDMARQA